MIDRRLILIFALASCGEAPEQAAVSTAAELEAPKQAAPSAPVKSRARQSGYSIVDMGRCRTLEENKYEGPYWRGLCPGYAGWKFEWTESDLRQDIILIDKSGRKTELGLSGWVAQGAFNTLNGGKIEWRGNDLAKPDTLIVRMNVDSPEERPAPDISKLAVVRLSPTPCVIAVVEPVAGQNAKARAIADGAERDCVTS